MNIKPSKEFFKQSINAHSWLGLMVGGLMYLICLSGTLAVYYEELERWEQPSAQEYLDYDVDIVDEAFNDFLNSGKTEITPHMYVTLPTKANPRVALITENDGWFLNKDGSYGPSTAHPYTDVITDMHLYLHLPKTWGMIFVSALGVLLLALIISGFASHRALFKDAFKLRIFGSTQLEQTDIHNRLSVWGAPFHLMIAFTGAFFGLSMIVLTLYAMVHNNNDIDGLTQLVFGQEPELNQTVKRIELGKALRQMPELEPDSEPLFVIVHDTGTPQQFIEVFSQYPNRLIYSDNFAFDASGNFLHREGFSDGEIGKQIVYSMYRLHFGHFGGWWTKLIYFLLGLALTVVSVSGINIWLSKRKHKDAINDLWVGFVWGTPSGLVVPAICSFAFNATSNLLFWATVIIACAYALIVKNEDQARLILKRTLAALSALLLLTYIAKYGSDAFTGIELIINSSIALMIAYFATISFRKQQAPSNLKFER